MSKLLLGVLALALAYRQVRADVPAWGQCGGMGWNGETTYAYRGHPTTNPYPPGSGLNGRFVAAGKVCWGVAVDLTTFNTPAATAVLKSDFGCITPLSAWTWDITEPTPGYFTFVTGDAILGWAITNGKRIWARTYTSAIQSHVSRVVGRYTGKIYAWDVISEMFNENGSTRTSVFSNVFGGDGFVNVAFQAARSADPNAKLYITEYNINSVNAKLNGMVNLVKKVNSGGTKLIDGCGIHAQLSPSGASGLLSAINALGAAGCEVSIVDLEVSSGSDYTAVDPYGRNVFLFDSNYRPNAAYTAVMNALPAPTMTAVSV